MKTPTKIFILVLLMLAFLASLAWVGVRHIADILREFDHVAQVDLILMEGATNLNNIQLKKEIVFEKDLRLFQPFHSNVTRRKRINKFVF